MAGNTIFICEFFGSKNTISCGFNVRLTKPIGLLQMRPQTNFSGLIKTVNVLIFTREIRLVICPMTQLYNTFGRQKLTVKPAEIQLLNIP